MKIIAKMIDCATPLTAQNCADLKKAGISAVGRYLGRKSRGYPKAMTPEEVAIIHDAELKIVSIWEGDPTLAGYFTAAQGILDADDAVMDARWLGQPEKTPIYFTVDFDAQAADMNAIRAYLQAVRLRLGTYALGIYGNDMVMSNVATDYYWQTCAWSAGAISPRAHIYQHPSTMLAGISVDEDDVYAPPGWWGSVAPAPAPAPVSKTYAQGYADGIAAAIKTLEGIKR